MDSGAHTRQDETGRLAWTLGAAGARGRGGLSPSSSDWRSLEVTGPAVASAQGDGQQIRGSQGG